MGDFESQQFTKRPGAVMMPGVDKGDGGGSGGNAGGGGNNTGGGGNSTGGNGRPTMSNGGGNLGGGGGNAAAGGGRPEVGGGGGGCEQYHCSCESVKASVDAYNDAVAGLGSILNGLKDIPGDIKKVAKDINDRLKNIDAKLPEGDGTKPNDCKNDCGGPGDLKSLMKELFPSRSDGKANVHPIMEDKIGLGTVTKPGADIGNLYMNCCAGGESKPEDPFKPTDPQNDGPCGRAGDSIENTPLFICDDIIDFDDTGVETDTIEVSLLSCKEGSPCEDGKPSISLDQIPGGVKLKIPKLSGQADQFKDRLKALKNFVDNLKDVTNKEQNVGGANGDLKKEACITRLLDKMCADKLTGGPKDGAVTKGCQSAGCVSPQKPSTGKVIQQPNDYHCCHQLMRALADKTLTYGHTGVGPEGRGWNDKPTICPERDRVIGSDWAYIPPGGSAEAAIAERVAKLEDLFPGCGKKDGSEGIVNPQPIPDSLKPCVEGDCPCGKAAPTVMDAAKQAELQNTQQELERKKVELETLQKAVQEADQHANQLAEELAKAADAGAPEIELNRIKTMIQANIKLSVELGLEITKVETQMQQLQNKLNDLMKNVNVADGAMCIKFAYGYCPANSTPKEGNANETNSNFGKAARSQRNFFDLLSRINESMGALAKEIGCNNPIAPHIQDCMGEQVPNGKKDPAPDRDGKLRPKESKNRGNTIKNGDSCSDNDNVAEIEGWFYPECIGKDEAGRDKQSQPRAECVQKLFRIMKNWSNKVGDQKIGEKLSKLSEAISGLDTATKGVAVLAGDLAPDQPNACKGWTPRKLNSEIEKITKAVQKAGEALKKLQNLAKEL
jgi:hypothetical protein